MITRQNYEIYALDYIEGRLPDDLKKEFERFLNQNPDIREEILSLRNTIAVPTPGDIPFPNKNQLKRSHIDGLTYTEELIISDIEGIATEKQKKELAGLIAHSPQIAREYQAFQQTRLKAPDITYPHKQGLKRKIIDFPTIARGAIAYAALLMMFLAISTFLNKPDKQILTSIQLSGHFEQIIFLTPGDISPFPDISRPVVVSHEKEKLTSSKTEMAGEPTIATIENSSKDSQIVEKIHPRTFSVEPELTHEIVVYKPSQTHTLYSTLSNITTNTTEKLSTWLEKQGIRVSRREFMIKINDKSYGISVAGK